MIKIVVDIQGADKHPADLIDGVLGAINETEELLVYLCGNKGELEACLNGKSYCAERLILVDAPDVITGSDDPMNILKTKQDSSLVKGLALCQTDHEIGGFVSCGATGAIFVASMMLLGRIGHMSPMLLCELRKQDNTPFCIVDCGANVDCRAEKLYDFAHMGVAYMKTVGTANPKVGLLSNGTEDEKGNATVKRANELLRQSGLNFIGNVEGSHILDGEADVVVCEGFAGNILLKTIEGSAKAVVNEWRTLAERLPENEKTQIMQIASKLYDKYDYNAQGGAVLLGVNIPIVKGHGAADSQTIYHIIEIAYGLAKNNLVGKIKDEFELT